MKKEQCTLSHLNGTIASLEVEKQISWILHSSLLRNYSHEKLLKVAYLS